MTLAATTLDRSSAVTSNPWSASDGASVAAGLAKVQAKRALIIGVKTDFLFPIHQQQELAQGLSGEGRKVEYHELDSLQGHDSFLVDMDRYRPILANFFA